MIDSIDMMRFRELLAELDEAARATSFHIKLMQEDYFQNAGAWADYEEERRLRERSRVESTQPANFLTNPDEDLFTIGGRFQRTLKATKGYLVWYGVLTAFVGGMVYLYKYYHYGGGVTYWALRAGVFNSRMEQTAGMIAPTDQFI